MKLTRIERAILVNQLHIRTALAKGKEDFAEHIEVLQNGYETHYSGVIEAIGIDPDSGSVSEEESRFVHDVLDVYRAIDSYTVNHPEDSKEEWARFPGFCGNTESKLMGYAQFVIHTLGHYEEQLKFWSKTADFNSHMPMSDIYQRMIRKLQEFPKGRRSLTRDDVLALQEARKYPG